MKALAALIALSFALTIAVPADAAQLRHPSTGSPAFMLTVPDDWASRITPNGGMIVSSPDRMSALSLNIVRHEGPLDALATSAFQVANGDPPTRAGAVTVSGYAGNTYLSGMTNAAGVHMHMRMVLVRLDPARVASFTLLTADHIPTASMAVANGVVRAITLTPAQRKM